MTEQEILDGNKLIAEFMGYKIWFKDGHTIVVETSYNITQPIKGWAKYHTSWNWLMPVVEKIEAIHHVFEGDYINVRISQGYVEIEGTKTRIFRNTSIEGSKINAVYLACVDFIKWHNSQTPASKGASR